MKAGAHNYNLSTMSDLNVSFAGLSLRYPIVVEASSPTISVPVVQRVSDAPTGAIVMPPFAPALPSTADPSGEYAPNNRGDAADRDTDSIIRSLDADSYFDSLGGVCSVSSVPVIASLSVYRRRQAVAYAQMMMDAGAAAVELRPFEHHAIRSLRADHIEKNVIRIAAAFADRVDIPIILRIPVTGYGIEAFAEALGACGIAGIVLEPFDDLGTVNTDRVSLERDPDGAETAVSGFQTVLAATRRLYRRITPHIAVPIPSGRGKAGIEAVLSGATVVNLSLDLEDMAKSVSLVSSHVRNLQGWMGSRRNDSLFDFRGQLSESRLSSSLD